MTLLGRTVILRHKTHNAWFNGKTGIVVKESTHEYRDGRRIDWLEVRVPDTDARIRFLKATNVIIERVYATPLATEQKGG